jgi:DNA ligase-1
MKEQPQSIIKRIAETNSKNEKQDILVELLKDDDYKEFFDGLRMCFSSFDTYGVKKVPEKTEDEGQGLPWVAFVDLQSKLANRDLTGHDARDAILLSMDVATQEQWNGWYRRILIKDMRAGFSESTVNKACKKAKKED